MHEMGIALAILKTAMNAIPKGMESGRVSAINLRVGKLSTVVPDSLCFCFDVLRKDTPLSRAKLNIEEVPVVLRCLDCGSEKAVEEVKFVCHECGSADVRRISGRELTVESIELAGPEEQGAAEG